MPSAKSPTTPPASQPDCLRHDPRVAARILLGDGAGCELLKASSKARCARRSASTSCSPHALLPKAEACRPLRESVAALQVSLPSHSGLLQIDYDDTLAIAMNAKPFLFDQSPHESGARLLDADTLRHDRVAAHYGLPSRDRSPLRRAAEHRASARSRQRSRAPHLRSHVSGAARKLVMEVCACRLPAAPNVRRRRHEADRGTQVRSRFGAMEEHRRTRRANRAPRSIPLGLSVANFE